MGSNRWNPDDSIDNIDNINNINNTEKYRSFGNYYGESIADNTNSVGNNNRVGTNRSNSGSSVQHDGWLHGCFHHNHLDHICQCGSYRLSRSSISSVGVATTEGACRSRNV